MLQSLRSRLHDHVDAGQSPRWLGEEPRRCSRTAPRPLPRLTVVVRQQVKHVQHRRAVLDAAEKPQTAVEVLEAEIRVDSTLGDGWRLVGAKHGSSV